jgi:hypothetical protein
MNLLHFIVQWVPFQWSALIAITSFYHFIWYLVVHYFPEAPPSLIGTKLTALYNFLRDGSRIGLITATFEILGLAFQPPDFRLLGRLVFAGCYIFGFVLYRYVTSEASRLVWQEYAVKFRQLVGYLPAFIGHFLLFIPQGLGKVGSLAFWIYMVRTTPVNPDL